MQIEVMSQSVMGNMHWRYVVVTSFFPRSLGLVPLRVSSYSAALVPPSAGEPTRRFVHYLQPWLGGTGAHLQVIDFVPVMHPIRQWADTFPWAARVSAMAHSFATRFPKQSPRGRRPVAVRVLVALEWLKHELGASEEDSCHRLRTDFAVMYACGLRAYQVNPAHAHFVLPETLCEFRRRIDEALMEALIAMQAAAAMAEGLVSPGHLVIDTFPREQGSQRVTEATTLSKAHKKRSRSSPTSRSRATAGPPHSTTKSQA